MEIPEYFVYCGIFITHRWDKRFAWNAKGEFLEVPNKTTSLLHGQKRAYYPFFIFGFPEIRLVHRFRKI